MQTAIGYVRVSTAGQAEDGVSLDAQRGKIEAWALANDYELVGIEIDAGMSGKRADNREALQRALDRACAERTALVVYSLSRLSRSTKDTLSIADKLDKAGADLVSLSEKIDTTSAAGKMVFRMLAVLAEFERDQIGERTRAALAHKRSKREKTGGDVPFGFDCVDGQLMPNRAEQKVIALVYELHGKGYSLRAIGRELRAIGARTKRGGSKWNPQTVKQIMTCKQGKIEAA